MKRTVLLADEDVHARGIAGNLLKARGLRVRHASSSDEACQILGRDEVAVVVLDLRLSGMNGFELLRHLHGRFGGLGPTTIPRIIALTDRQEPEVVRFALRLGADVCLRKPLAMVQFIRTVENLIGSAAPQAA